MSRRPGADLPWQAGTDRELLHMLSQTARTALSVLPAWWAAGAVLLLALVLGGGTRQGLWSDAIVQLASLPLLAISLVAVLSAEQRGQARVVLLILGAVALLPLLQLIPLPPGTWTAFPGRTELAAAYGEAEMSVPWLGISLSPPATWRSALSLIPPAAVFLAVLLLERRSRQALTLALIAFGFVSVLLGLMQIAQGPQSALRFHSVTNPAEAVGFFANRNHFAALLYVILPFTAAWAIGLAGDRRPEIMVGVALCLLVFASLLLGLGIARSRAGLLLAMLASVGSLALTWTGSVPLVSRRGKRFLFVGSLVGAVLVLQFASIGILQRLEADLADDLRWELSRESLNIAAKFQPLGTGIGTFEPIYRMHEDVDRLRTVYANRAHNDYAELLVEAGWAAGALVIVFLGWLVVESVRVWRRPRMEKISVVDLSIERAAMITLVLICLHSIVDYPLRTTALSTLFAFSCALMIRPLTRQSDKASEGSMRAARPVV